MPSPEFLRDNGQGDFLEKWASAAEGARASTDAPRSRIVRVLQMHHAPLKGPLSPPAQL